MVIFRCKATSATPACPRQCLPDCSACTAHWVCDRSVIYDTNEKEEEEAWPLSWMWWVSACPLCRVPLCRDFPICSLPQLLGWAQTGKKSTRGWKARFPWRIWNLDETQQLIALLWFSRKGTVSNLRLTHMKDYSLLYLPPFVRLLSESNEVKWWKYS